MTSGGPSPDGLTPLQDKVVGIIGDTQIDGIAGGIDTCQASDSPMDQMREEFESSFETALPAISGTSSAGDDKSLFTQTRSSPYTESSKETLVEIERERLAVEKDRLTIEKERLATEKPGLEIEKKIPSHQRTKIPTVYDKAELKFAANWYIREQRTCTSIF